MLSNLRKQPEEFRRQLALFFTIIIAGVLFVLWASFFKLSNHSMENNQKDSAPGPFMVLWESFSNTASGVKNSVSEGTQSIKGIFSGSENNKIQ